MVVRISGLGLVPIAMTTASQSMTQLESGMGTGLQAALGVGLAQFHLLTSMPVTRSLSSPSIWTGLFRSWNSMPSGMA